LRQSALQSLTFEASRFAGLAGICLILSGCGSIVNIPLGSLWSSPKTDTVATAANSAPAPETTGSIAPAPAPGKVTAEEKPGFLSKLLPSFGNTKTAEAKKPDDKPFTLDAPPETTGSIPAPATVEPKTFAQDDHKAVAEVIGEVLPEKGSPVSQSWVNPITGYGGMVVPMAQLKKSAGTCRELLISFGKDTKKDWYKGQSCQKSGKWQLGDVTAWRTSK
jgi:hypothetical protein